MIPVCEPLLAGRELDYVTDCIKTNWVSSQGKYIEQFEEQFASYCGCRYGISTTSGTTALHLALASVGIGQGDEVILPSFTMGATAFAVVYTGATPVLADSDGDTWNIDPARLEQLITSRTRAIMPVHIYGHPCDMDPIMEIAERHNLFVIEDAAEAHGAEYKGRKAGSFGLINCFSFYANKIITTGEGGMVVTNDLVVANKARRLKDLAHSSQKRYLHTEIGFNYRMTNIQAAMGVAQLERIDQYIDARRRHALLYNARLKNVDGIVLPPEKEWAKNVYWMYSILVSDKFGLSRDDLMSKLKDKGIDTRAFFIPMHLQPVFLEMGLFVNEKYPVAEQMGRQGFYLPSGSGLKDQEIEFICESLNDIHDGK
jgi:perosamine synthetase